MNNLEQQHNYSRWATMQWLEFIYLDERNDQYLYKLISHIVKGERAWLERIELKDWNRDLWQTETKEYLIQLMDDNQTSVQHILSLPLNNRIKIERLNGQVYEPKISDILQHTFFHGENHRGQLASFCAKTMSSYPKTDYMSFCLQKGC